MDQKRIAKELVKIAKSITSIQIVDVRELEGRYREFQEQAEKLVILTVKDLAQIIRQINYENGDLADVIYQRDDLRPTEHKFTDEDKKIVEKEQMKRGKVKKGIQALIKILEQSRRVFR